MDQLKLTIKEESPTIEGSEILADYRLACESREASMLGRKEVFLGKAKFGIFGDGKEVAQIALAKVFRKGDFRAGYYRDQTWMMAIGELTLSQYFAQLYAHTDVDAEPHSVGRQMNCHFATRMIDERGELKDLVNLMNSTADISATASQMPRMVGLAYASKLFRENKELSSFTHLSDNGNEISFGSIGNASTAEGLFFEAMNAAGVLQIPMLVSIWDDEFGISVPQRYQTTKTDMTKLFEGFQRTADERGIELFTVRGWDYEALCETYRTAERICREEHVPVLIHVTELTQPQGHSTSGSHERYKTDERLAWEKDHDCLRKMRGWILEEGCATEGELQAIEAEAKAMVKAVKTKAWREFNADVQGDQRNLAIVLQKATEIHPAIGEIRSKLDRSANPLRNDSIKAAKKALRLVKGIDTPVVDELKSWIKNAMEENAVRYSSHLYSQSVWSALNVSQIDPVYTKDSPMLDGREVLKACFIEAFQRDPTIFALGEDLGKIGDVNQGFAGLQEKFGEIRVTDTGIRESTIIGQGIGAALRGLRPIVEIQYLDYLLYTLQTLSDDLASLRYRTGGGQKSPLIIRTRGHRLEGIWHSGSPMSMILGSLRGIYVLVPRDMTQAAGLYNTLFQSDDPAIMIECLNGYRLKERLPENVGEFTVPLGVPDVLKRGEDITIVTYGAMCKVVMEAAKDLEHEGISCDVIDVQTLSPFDVNHLIVESIKRTNRVVFADEDVPGGASAYMLQKVLEEQGAYQFLDSAPVTISAKEHRPAYGSDGDYFSKPNPEEVFDTVYNIMHEADPEGFPSLYD